jgi:hypothetical protein
MVESNNSEERLARIEDMLQALQREAGVLKTTTAKIIGVVQATLAPDTPRTSHGSERAKAPERRGRRVASAITWTARN